MKGLRFVPSDTHVPFIRWRMISLAASSVLIVASIVLFLTAGLNYGIDFKGGTMIEIKNKSGPVNLSEMRTKMNGLGLGEVQIQEFGAPDDVLIRIGTQEGGDASQQIAIQKVKESLGDTVDYRRVEVVGPTVSGELIQSGTIAVLVAIFAVLVYIWFRFEWHFGVGAVIALVHDVVLSMGMFAITQMEFNLATIAALLTIVGYSINDTVVVYDRVRENLRKYKTMPLGDVLNLSINDTLSRTTMTSVTTLLALFALFIFGGEVIKGFVFAMIWGIFVGTYSSIFVAAPLLMILGLDRNRFDESGAPKTAEAGD